MTGRDRPTRGERNKAFLLEAPSPPRRIFDLSARGLRQPLTPRTFLHSLRAKARTFGQGPTLQTSATPTSAPNPSPPRGGGARINVDGFSRARTRRPSNSAFTLIELLAVIVILSLIAGVTMANLSATDDATALREAIAAARDLEQRGRLFSQTGQPVMMAPSRDRHALLLKTVRGGETVSAARMPRDATVHLDLPRTRREMIVFDSFGRSADYRLIIRHGTKTLSWQIRGLSGSFAEEAPR